MEKKTTTRRRVLRRPKSSHTEAEMSSFSPQGSRAALFIALVASTSWACTETPTGVPLDDDEPPQTGDELVLPVRVHVLESDSVGSLNADLDAGEVAELIFGVNLVWEPAGVRWDLEAVIREPTTATAAFLAMRDGFIPFDPGVLLGPISPRTRVPGAWDIYIFHDLGATPIAGIYLRDGLTLSKLAIEGLPVELGGFAARVLAHELGHSLGLQHVPCVAEGNLMAAGCVAADRVRLEPFQIAAARSQAGTGRPF